MKNKDIRTKQFAHSFTLQTLRQQAEDYARDNIAPSNEETQKILQELYIHQIELEMQNEELRHMYAELDSQKKLMEAVNENIPDPFVIYDKEGKLINMNTVGRKLFPQKDGINTIESVLSGFKYFDLKNNEIPLGNLPSFRAFRGESVRNEVIVIKLPEKEQIAEVNATPIFDNDNNLISIASYYRDITETVGYQKVVQQNLEQQIRNEKRFRTCFDNMYDCIDIYTAVRDESYRITDFIIDYSNEAACVNRKMTEEETVGESYVNHFHNLVTRARFDELCQIVETGVPLMMYAVRSVNSQHLSEVHDWRISKLNDGIVISRRDITRQKKMEEEMARLDQLNLVGAVAAGIGHEIRNPMTTVRGYLQLLGSKGAFTEYNSQFALMIDELDRANAIITEFLSMAKDRPIELKMQSVKKIVENIFPLIQADGLILDKYINLELDEVAEIPLDKKEMNQLILNLVLNASQSMSTGGTMIIRTFMDKEEIVLAVQDDGTGIAPEVLEKIGTPFFTTKESGTGLGLSVCYSIVARHNAKIDINTGSNGTTFFVRFKQ